MITYKVKLVGRKRSETVLADYFRIEGGVLTFRNANTQQGYPHFVKCFAAGAWSTVENVDVCASPNQDGYYRGGEWIAY